MENAPTVKSANTNLFDRVFDVNVMLRDCSDN